MRARPSTPPSPKPGSYGSRPPRRRDTRRPRIGPSRKASARPDGSGGGGRIDAPLGIAAVGHCPARTGPASSNAVRLGSSPRAQWRARRCSVRAFGRGPHQQGQSKQCTPLSRVPRPRACWFSDPCSQPRSSSRYRLPEPAPAIIGRDGVNQVFHSPNRSIVVLCPAKITRAGTASGRSRPIRASFVVALDLSRDGSDTSGERRDSWSRSQESAAWSSPTQTEDIARGSARRSQGRARVRPGVSRRLVAPAEARPSRLPWVAPRCLRRATVLLCQPRHRRFPVRSDSCGTRSRHPDSARGTCSRFRLHSVSLSTPPKCARNIDASYKIQVTG